MKTMLAVQVPQPTVGSRSRLRLLILGAVVAGLAACGGGSGSSTDDGGTGTGAGAGSGSGSGGGTSAGAGGGAVTYTLAGTVSGLAAGQQLSLVLDGDSAHAVVVSANASVALAGWPPMAITRHGGLTADRPDVRREPRQRQQRHGQREQHQRRVQHGGVRCAAYQLDGRDRFAGLRRCRAPSVHNARLLIPTNFHAGRRS